MRTLFAVAGWLAPAVIFIDEVDSILSARKAEGAWEPPCAVLSCARSQPVALSLAPPQGAGAVLALAGLCSALRHSLPRSYTQASPRPGLNPPPLLPRLPLPQASTRRAGV